MRLVTISDTHCQISSIEKDIPEGDILVHSGDLTYRGDIPEVSKEFKGLGRLRKRFKRVVFCAGNHDWMAERDPALFKLLAEENGLTWLQDDRVTIDNIHFYGSGWTPEFGSWALNLSRYDSSLADAWEKIPEGIDVLITHGPPQNILDETAGYHEVTYARERYTPPEHVGCFDLAQRVKIVKPKIHVFGHIHHSYGSLVKDGTLFLNASVCNEKYKPVNPPFIVDLVDGKATLVDWVAQKEVKEIEKTLPKEWL